MLIAPSNGGGLPFLMPARFEQFYRARLRRIAGSRIGSSALLKEYEAWAVGAGQAPLSFKALRQSLEAIGHRRRKSDGICYLDLAFVEDAPGISDTLDDYAGFGERPHAAAASALVDKVDQLLAVALELRAALTAAGHAPRPHEAAQRVLGLFDQ